MVLENRAILVMEDNVKNMKLFRDVLQVNGCRVIEAVNGKEGVEQAKLQVPDLIILDWSMPVMNGQAVIELLKVDRATRNIPILVVTASAMINEEKLIKQSGCDEYLSKPVSIPELLMKMEKLLS